MALHHQIRLLAAAMGPRIFSDSQEFRAAMDDYFGEDSMSSGEMSLLVDAVRYDAYTQMMRILDGGAPPEAAIIAAGDTLADKRGQDNPQRCRWAVACLGFAANRIDDTTLSRFPYSKTTDAPATYPVAVPQTSMPPGPSNPGSVGPPVYTNPPPKKRSWNWVLAAAAVLAIALAAAAFALVLQDDDGDTPTTQPVADPEHEHGELVDAKEVRADFAALGEFDLELLELCHPTSAPTGETRLGCFNGAIDMTLITYENEEALAFGRVRLPTEPPVCHIDTGVFSARDFTTRELVRVYWDDTESLVAARITAEDHHVDEVDAFLVETGDPGESCPAIAAPEHEESDHEEPDNGEATHEEPDHDEADHDETTHEDE